MTLPASLQQHADAQWQSLDQIASQLLLPWQGDAKEKLHRALGLSDFISQSFHQSPALLTWLHAHQTFSPKSDHYRAVLAAQLDELSDEHQVMSCLRAFRRQHMLWLAWQDFHNQMDVETGLIHLSALAEAMIMATYDWLYQDACQSLGTPCDEAGQAQVMLILGMGKLGGEELNFSSDIDLIFTYPENGETQGARRSIANAQFFTRLGQRLIKLLDQQTVDGFCYRVDMRLRPFGDSGPLVMSFAALEDYYQEQGRDWERYAMIKARVMGREQFACYQILRTMLRPFVFRRYIDFGAIEALRRMKKMIQREVRRRGLTDNIKLGAGGIREIEFIAQSFQLIRGGREPSLRKRSLLETLDAISALDLLPINDVHALKQAYLFLRRVENLLQAIGDKQTQTLPSDSLNQTRLITVLGFDHWQGFLSELQAHTERVHQIFEAMIGDDPDEQLPDRAPVYQEIWDSAREASVTEVMIEEVCSQDVALAAKALAQFKMELSKRTLGPRGREVLNRLMPLLLEKLLIQAPALHERIYALLVQIASRTTYLELLVSHPVAVDQLLRLCLASPRIAQQLASYPILLDELLDSNQLYQPLPFEQYRAELSEYLARIPEQDMEQQMEMIRQFKQSQLLRIAAADISGALPVMKVSDHLTYLAEAIVQAVVSQAWFQLVEKYGKPSHLDGEMRGFAVIGYGKVGGIELGYGSDLDIVFVHNCPDQVMTDGEKSIDGRQFYLRLAQRIVHLFSTRTATGVLYEIDTRLRPSGASGMMVTTLDSFADYQANQAWVWEHQALVRARVIDGDTQLSEQFESIRREILTAPRDLKGLSETVANMRQKMRMSHASSANVFDLKQGVGGITDIEFLTQFLVLGFAHEQPSLTQWRDNVRVLAQCKTLGILSQVQADALIEAYVTMRNEIHRLSLQEQPVSVSESEFQEERKQVQRIWQQVFKSEG